MCHQSPARHAGVALNCSAGFKEFKLGQDWGKNSAWPVSQNFSVSCQKRPDCPNGCFISDGALP